MPAPDPEGPGPFSMASTERMTELLESFAGEDGYQIPGVALCGVAS